jgi:hypothetical protein
MARLVARHPAMKSHGALPHSSHAAKRYSAAMEKLSEAISGIKERLA